MFGALYADHATREQFHSEIKTDLGLERLPSVKFATNDLVSSLAALAYNVLRLIGQNALTGDDNPAFYDRCEAAFTDLSAFLHLLSPNRANTSICWRVSLLAKGWRFYRPPCLLRAVSGRSIVRSLRKLNCA